VSIGTCADRRGTSVVSPAFHVVLPVFFQVGVYGVTSTGNGVRKGAANCSTGAVVWVHASASSVHHGETVVFTQVTTLARRRAPIRCLCCTVVAVNVVGSRYSRSYSSVVNTTSEGVASDVGSSARIHGRAKRIAEAQAACCGTVRECGAIIIRDSTV